MSRILNKIKTPRELKKFSVKDLPRLAGEIRELIIDVVSKNGGHLASSLGSVELIIALHYLLDTPRDSIVFDVGHQSYAHKILTERKKRFETLRRLGGLSGFPSRNEGDYDPFTVGHSSTSISTALGLACARDFKKDDKKIVVMIGDAALGGGMAFEAMNQAGHMKKDLLVILNDNELSISPTVGALSTYLNRIITNPFYNKFHDEVANLIKKIPKIGSRALRATRRFEEGLKNLFVPGVFFEEMGFRDFGPIDGHNIKLVIATLKDILKLKQPVLLHVLTKKGKGYKFAEAKPALFHSAPPFDKTTGKPFKEKKSKTVSFTRAFSDKLISLAHQDKRIIAITAAMPDGTGLADFAREFPARFFDVGIAEQHAVGFAAGLAKGGLKPVVAIYSTFLQRAYDQIIHDVSLQNLPVVFCLDRSGLVGEDGPTHHGVFDISCLRHIPNLTIACPGDAEELKEMLELAVKSNKPFAIRYPKGSPALKLRQGKPSPVEYGKSETVRKGKDIAIIALGSMVETALDAAEALQNKKISVEVINARFAKPLDENMLEEITSRIKKIVILEENVISGGFGSAVAEFIERERIEGVKLEMVGLPDEFVEHGPREVLLNKYNMSKEGLVNLIIGEVL